MCLEPVEEPVEHEKEAWQVNIHCNNKLTDLGMQGGEVVSVGIRLVRGKLSGTTGLVVWLQWH